MPQALPYPGPASIADTLHHPAQQEPGCEDGEGWELWPLKAMSPWGQTFYTFLTGTKHVSAPRFKDPWGTPACQRLGPWKEMSASADQTPPQAEAQCLSHIWQEGQSHSPSGQMLSSACSLRQDLKVQCESARGPRVSGCLGVIPPEGSSPPPCASLKSGLNC